MLMFNLSIHGVSSEYFGSFQKEKEKGIKKNVYPCLLLRWITSSHIWKAGEKLVNGWIAAVCLFEYVCRLWPSVTTPTPSAFD